MTLGILIVLSFLVVFPIFWIGITYLISLFGWQTLAKYYASQMPIPSGLQTASGMVNLAGYRSTLLFKADERGMWLKVMPIFSPGHKPLFIPWAAVEHYEATNTFWLYKSKLRVRGVTIRLDKDLSKWL